MTRSGGIDSFISCRTLHLAQALGFAFHFAVRPQAPVSMLKLKTSAPVG